MSKRAEEKAIAYADKKLQVVDPELWETSYTRYRKMSVSVMSGCDVEEAYIEGYEQAEKDIALTVKDLELLHTFLYAVKNNKQGCFTFTRLSDGQYQEVLRRFNEQRP